MVLLPVCLFALLQIASGQNRRRVNVHVTFGDLEPCEAPPSGTCADFSITEDQVTDSLAKFREGSLKTSSPINYYGEWWKNFGTAEPIPGDFCVDGGDGANQTSTLQAYNGVDYTLAHNGQWIMGTYSTPAADCENYCSAVGGTTPPHMGTDFDIRYTPSFSLMPSSKNRQDISNSVGYAVDGVVIFSPFTFIRTVAAYDETLDTCGGHPAGGEYHYHGFSPCIHDEKGDQTGASISHSEIYGWAFDGFPIYGPYGYEDGNDASSLVVRVTGGYACTSNSSPCTTDAEKAIPENWAYSPSNEGMLDDCNGRWTKTPQFPNGMYVYVLNVQANGSPDFPGVPYCYQQASTQTSTSTTTVTTTTVTTTTVTTTTVSAVPTTTVTTTVAPTDPSCSAVDGIFGGNQWTDQRCSNRCGDASNCHLKCQQKCNDQCACNSRRLVASILV